jgi:hypothetical protein
MRDREKEGKKEGISAELSSLSLRRYEPHQVPRVEASASLSSVQCVQSTPSETWDNVYLICSSFVNMKPGRHADFFSAEYGGNRA